ncbi:hypothetical protein C2845_PM11G05790 [Panicum miliaceum]|uniref:Uncharacterized protein n=1 Tax=Panicum miliaceum TaxID=4540 RepID=A0A3L6RUM9_PANMI|nr:hypothetical protein C2845_PM11G05790 [Panicum miliaceum]
MEEAVEATKNMEKKKTKGRSKPSKRAKKNEEDVFRDKRPSWSNPRRSTSDLTRNKGCAKRLSFQKPCNGHQDAAIMIMIRKYSAVDYVTSKLHLTL